MPLGENRRQGFGRPKERLANDDNFIRNDKEYNKDCTVRINNILIDKVKAISVLNAVERITGLNTVLAIVRCDYSYEVTLDNKKNARKLLDGLEIEDKDYDCSLVFSDITVVSFMYLPAYVKDEEIIAKLYEKRIKLVSDIFRRVIPNTQVADGTRFVKCVFPPDVIALPWTMPFKFGKTVKYYKCVHNNQTKVCSECLSPEHIHRFCPYLVCNGCGLQGHVERKCRAFRSFDCRELPAKCVCNQADFRKRPENVCPECKEINCTCLCKKCNTSPCVCTLLCEKCGKMDCDCRYQQEMDDNSDNEVSFLHKNREANNKNTDEKVPEDKDSVVTKTSADLEVRDGDKMEVEVLIHEENESEKESRKRKIDVSDDDTDDETEGESGDEEMKNNSKEESCVNGENEKVKESYNAITENKKSKRNEKVEEGSKSEVANSDQEGLAFKDFDQENWEKNSDVSEELIQGKDVDENYVEMSDNNESQLDDDSTQNSDSTNALSVRELRNRKKKEAKKEAKKRRAMLKVKPNVHIERSDQKSENKN